MDDWSPKYIKHKIVSKECKEGMIYCIGCGNLNRLCVCSQFHGRGK